MTPIFCVKCGKVDGNDRDTGKAVILNRCITCPDWYCPECYRDHRKVCR